MRNKRFFVTLIVLGLSLSILTACGRGGGGGSTGSSAAAPSENPAPFNLVSPGSNDNSSGTPLFTWTASAHAAVYTVQVASNPTFTVTLLDKTVPVPYKNLDSATVLHAGLADGETYYWRVTAMNTLGSTLATAGTLTYAAFTVRTSGGAQWAAVSGPTGTGGEPFAIALDPGGVSLYVVGYDTDTGAQDDQWRIEKRKVSDGSLVPDFGTAGVARNNPGNSFDDAYAATVDANGLYVVGFDSTGPAGAEQWRIEKRNPVTGATTGFGTLNSAGTGSYNRALATAITGTSLVVAGFDTDAANHEEWRIEYRDLASGLTNTVITSASGTNLNGCEAYAVAVDGASVYVAGYDSLFGPEMWRLEKRSDVGVADAVFGATTGVISPAIQGTITALATNPSMTALLAAGTDVSGGSDVQWRIMKLDKISGSPDPTFGGGAGSVTSNPSGDADEPNAIVVDYASGKFYVAGFETVASGDLAWRIEKRDLATGDIDTGFGDGGHITYNPAAGGADVIWGMASDGNGLYLAGYDSVPGVHQWHVEKRSK